MMTLDKALTELVFPTRDAPSCLLQAKLLPTGGTTVWKYLESSVSPPCKPW